MLAGVHERLGVDSGRGTGPNQSSSHEEEASADGRVEISDTVHRKQQVCDEGGRRVTQRYAGKQGRANRCGVRRHKAETRSVISPLRRIDGHACALVPGTVSAQYVVKPLDRKVQKLPNTPMTCLFCKTVAT